MLKSQLTSESQIIEYLGFLLVKGLWVERAFVGRDSVISAPFYSCCTTLLCTALLIAKAAASGTIWVLGQKQVQVLLIFT